MAARGGEDTRGTRRRRDRMAGRGHCASSGGGERGGGAGALHPGRALCLPVSPVHSAGRRKHRGQHPAAGAALAGAALLVGDPPLAVACARGCGRGREGRVRRVRRQARVVRPAVGVAQPVLRHGGDKRGVSTMLATFGIHYLLAATGEV